MTSPRSKSRERLLVYCASIPLLVPALTLVMLVRLYHNVPWGDHIGLFYHTRLWEGLTLGKLFHFHNEHQIVFAKLIIYLDYSLTYGSSLLCYSTSVLLALAIPLFYCLLLKKHRVLNGQGSLLLASSLVLALFFNGRLLWTLTSAILIQHLSANLFVILAIYFFWESAPPGDNPEPGARRARQRVPLAAFCLLSACAAMSSASGLLVGPSLLAISVVLAIAVTSVSRRRLIRAALVGLATTTAYGAIYVGGYLLAVGRGSGSRGFDIVGAARFLALFPGGVFFRDSDWPIVHHPHPILIATVTLLFWLFLGWLAVQLYRRRPRLTAFEAFHASVIVFVLLAGAVGALFRSQLDPLEAINNKYVPTALLAWISALSLLLRFRKDLLLGKSGFGWRRPAAISAVVVCLVIPGDLVEFRAWREWMLQVRETALSAASGVYSANLLKRFYYSDPMAYEVVSKFIERREYFYRSLRPVGYNLESRYNSTGGDSLPTLAAAIEPVRDIPGLEGVLARGVLPRGVLPNGTALQHTHLVVTDAHNQVIGYGAAAQAGRTGTGISWFAAFRQQAPFTAARLYGVSGSNAYPIGRVELPTEPPLTPLDQETRTRLGRIPDHTDYGLELFNGVENPIIQPPVHMTVRAEIHLSGWAVDRQSGNPAEAVEVLINRNRFQVAYGSSRPDVASYLGQPTLANSGFSFALPAAKIGEGKHQLRLRIHVKERQGFLETSPVEFYVDQD